MVAGIQSVFYGIIAKGQRKPSKLIERDGGGVLLWPFEDEAERYLAEDMGGNTNFSVVPINISIECDLAPKVGWTPPCRCGHFREDTEVCTVGCNEGKVVVQPGNVCPWADEDAEAAKCPKYKH